VGVHASISPVHPDDTKLPRWSQHRTRIWVILAVIAVVNLAATAIQNRRLISSTVTTEQFTTAIQSLKDMYKRESGVNVLAGPASASTPTSTSADQAKTGHLAVAKKATTDTSLQTSLIAQSSKPVILPLTQDQITLVVQSANDLARSIRDDYAVAAKKYWDDFNAGEQEQRDDLLRRGMSKADADQMVASQHTGSGAASRASDLLDVERQIIDAKTPQIQAIMNVLRSDPTRFQGKLERQVTLLQSDYEVPTIAGVRVNNCATGLEAVAAVAKL
jgi:hypothetical protein